MGKRTKKKKSGQKTPQERAGGQQQTPSEAPSPNQRQKLDSDQVSLYRIYKHCTEAVIQWGKTAFQKKRKKKPTDGNSTKGSLSHIIFDILGGLADDGVLMPDLVLHSLDTAISYRLKVQGIYQKLPQVSKDNYRRHQWIIQQLQVLQKRFLVNKEQFEENNENRQQQPREESTRTGFEALALSDDESSVDDCEDATPGTPAKTTAAPTSEEIAAEERQFAIALFMYDVDSIRQNLRRRWRGWAEKQASDPNQDDTERGKQLLAVTASTEYALSAVRKLFLQVSLEIDDSVDLETIIRSANALSGPSVHHHTLNDFHPGDAVSIVGLEKRPDLNGREGKVVVADFSSERLHVEIFPFSAASNGQNNAHETHAIHPKNLIFADSTLLRLREIHSVVESSWTELTANVPGGPPNVLGSPRSDSVHEYGINLIMQADRFEKAAGGQDFQSLLRLMVQHSLPIWMSLSQYLPDAGAADGVFNAYVRDFATTGVVKFQFVFALLVVLDGAIACAQEGRLLAQDTKNLNTIVVENATDPQVYIPAIKLLRKDGCNTDIVLTHLELAKHMAQEYSVAGMCFPFISGEMMFIVLKSHFVCGAGLVYAYNQQYFHILHIYWVLRQEGHLGKIKELESIAALYQQFVFFRGGLPRKGQGAFVKCLQLALGCTMISVRALAGKRVPESTGRSQSHRGGVTSTGLHVSEISRLLDILQWKSMPFADKDKCLNEVESIAKNDFAIFMTPQFPVGVKVMDLVRTLETMMSPYVRDSTPKMMPKFAPTFQRGPQLIW